MHRALPALLFITAIAGCAGVDTSPEAGNPDADASQGAEPRDTATRFERPPLRAEGLLVNPFDWVALPWDAAPFAGSEEVPCDAEAFGPEDLTGVWVFSIDTELCAWLSVTQPTALPIMPGDRIRARIWHFELTAPIDAKAYVALAIDETLLASEEKDIPSPSAFITLEVEVESEWPKGSQLIFHVDNHGANSWHLVEVELNPDDDNGPAP